MAALQHGGEVAQKHPTDIANRLDVMGSPVDLADIGRC